MRGKGKKKTTFSLLKLKGYRQEKEGEKNPKRELLSRGSFVERKKGFAAGIAKRQFR